MDYKTIFAEAVDAAKNAVSVMSAKYAHLPYGEPAYCGFAWVELPDGRSPAVREMRRHGIGSKHWRKGWMIWSPAQYGGQSMDIHEAGARAYAAVLRSHGIEAHAASRAD
jgi:hypothetical protein